MPCSINAFRRAVSVPREAPVRRRRSSKRRMPRNASRINRNDQRSPTLCSVRAPSPLRSSKRIVSMLRVCGTRRAAGFFGILKRRARGLQEV
jgi:hypothetical protein